MALRPVALGVASMLGAILLWALDGSNPYGYYQLLRWACCMGFVLLARYCFLHSQEAWVWGFGSLALLYNPLMPVSLGRPIWEAVNIGTVLVLATWAVMDIRRFRGAAS